MSYYHDKRKAWQLVDTLYAKKMETKKIVFQVSTLFGFGKKFVEERIELLESLSTTK